MSAILRQSALRSTRSMRGGYGRVQQRYASDVAAKQPEVDRPLNKGAKRDPELYVLMAIMTGAFGLAGLYFGRKPTSASSESKVSLTDSSMPWETDSSGKYRYHPGGDKSKTKDAPSALNTVIVPNVNLPKSLHDQFNKWGKDGY